MLALSANAQTHVAHTQVYHGDTLFLKKTTYTYAINSETRYVYSNHYEYDTTDGDPIIIDTILVLDTVPYTYFFKVITNTVSDSNQINKFPVFNPSSLNTKQDALASGTNIKTINGQPLLGSGDLSVSAVLASRLINGTPFDGTADIYTDVDLLAYAALGSTIKAETVGQRLVYSNVSTNMVDGQVKYTSVYLPKGATITGVRFYVRVLGAYTGDNNNRIGLYSYSNGVLTLVASSPNSATLWTNAANSVQQIAFSVPYVATAGMYYVGFLYNQSVQTTAPALASGVAINNLAMSSTAMGFANSAKLHGTANGTDLPASINMTAITASTVPTWVALY